VQPIECVLFDWDGTLVDSTAANYQALSGALRKHDIELDEAWYRARTGMSTDAMLAVLLAARPPGSAEVDLEQIALDRDSLFLQEAASIPPLAAVVDVARSYVRQVSLGVASGGSGPAIRATMSRLGLTSLFDCVVSREDVAIGKPAPDIFLLAAARLGRDPARCVVYEDSDEGIEAARRAGMAVVDVRPWRHDRTAPRDHLTMTPVTATIAAAPTRGPRTT
jgi:beta-phosphoglucomutase-like phosphatase (HAD superfamily)